MEPARARHGRPVGGVRITDRDRVALAFVAEHRLALGAQVQALLAVSAATASGRLRSLSQAGYLSAEHRLHRQPGCYQITRRGLGVIESPLPVPRTVDLSCYRHDVGLGWLWLAARAGSLGPVAHVTSERRMRSQDGRSEDRDARFGVRLGGVGPGGGERLHYADLLVETPSGQRVAFELELTAKSRRRREVILGGYASDPRIEAVVYLVDQPATGRAIAQSASRLGIADRVRVHRVTLDQPGPGGGSRTTRERRPRAVVR